MIWACLIVCLTALIIQSQAMAHWHAKNAHRGRLHDIHERLTALEGARSSQFDPSAFDDLKTKVEALRMAQGLKGSR